MAGVALLARAAGHTVSGCDASHEGAANAENVNVHDQERGLKEGRILGINAGCCHGNSPSLVLRRMVRNSVLFALMDA